MSATKPRSTRPVNVSPGFDWRSKAVVNQRQGQPQVRVESAADGQQGTDRDRERSTADARDLDGNQQVQISSTR